MSRRSFCVALALFGLLVGGAALALFLAVGYEPDTYAKAAVPPGELRAQRSRECFTEFCELGTNATGAEQNWSVQFADEQINSYLEEGFVKQGLASRLLPEGVSRPHVVFEPNKVHVAFRYGAWKTVISIDLRVWLARDEVNTVALELEGLRAGAVPISGQWLLEEFARVGRESGSGLDVSWYRINGHPVALLRFQSDQAHPTLLLQDVHFDRGTLVIRGRSTDGAQHAALFPLPDGLRLFND